jgi:hypothetical protein
MMFWEYGGSGKLPSCRGLSRLLRLPRFIQFHWNPPKPATAESCRGTVHRHWRCAGPSRLPCTCWMQSNRAVEAAIFASDQVDRCRKTSAPPSNGNAKRPATKHRWRDVDTNWWILKNTMSLASWRHAGTTRWNAWPGLSGGSRSCPPYRLSVRRSIVRGSSNSRRAAFLWGAASDHSR